MTANPTAANPEGKAWTWQTPADPTHLALAPQSIPEPRPDEIVVANAAIGLNPVDWKLIAGGPPGWNAGHIPGVDGVGIVVAAGANAALAHGARVAYHQDSRRDGSFARYTCLTSQAALPVPAALTDAVAAAFPCPGLTAWQALEKIPVAINRDVLIVGGGGTVGLFLVQLALARGFRVWTTASTTHRDRLLALGVAEVLDYHAADWHAHLQTALGSRKLYAAFDTVGEAHARALAPLVGYNGHLVCIQDRLNTPPVPPFTTVLSQHEIALGSVHRYGNNQDWQALRHAADTLLNQLATGSLQPPAVTTVAFDQIPHALNDLKNGKAGKYVAVWE